MTDVQKIIGRGCLSIGKGAQLCFEYMKNTNDPSAEIKLIQAELINKNTIVRPVGSVYA